MSSKESLQCLLTLQTLMFYKFYYLCNTSSILDGLSGLLRPGIQTLGVSNSTWLSMWTKSSMFRMNTPSYAWSSQRKIVIDSKCLSDFFMPLQKPELMDLQINTTLFLSQESRKGWCCLFLNIYTLTLEKSVCWLCSGFLSSYWEI